MHCSTGGSEATCGRKTKQTEKTKQSQHKECVHRLSVIASWFLPVVLFPVFVPTLVLFQPLSPQSSIPHFLFSSLSLLHFPLQPKTASQENRPFDSWPQNVKCSATCSSVGTDARNERDGQERDRPQCWGEPVRRPFSPLTRPACLEAPPKPRTTSSYYRSEQNGRGNGVCL